MPHRSGARGDTRLFHTTPAIFIFGLFSGSTATGALSLGSSAIALCTMHNENTAHYLDTNKFHDYAIELATKRLTNHPLAALVADFNR